MQRRRAIALRRIRRRVGPIGRVRECRARAEDMAMRVTRVRWHSESRCSRVRIGRVARRHRFSDDERDAAGRRRGRIVESAPKCRQTRMRSKRRTMRRVTLRIVPFLMVCYFISFLDRVNLGFAALQMVEDLHFSATVFGFGGGIFFLSYFLFEVPSNLLLEKFGARRWIARIMITWGVLAGAHGVGHGSALALSRAVSAGGRRSGILSRRDSLSHLLVSGRSTAPGSSGCSRSRFRSRAFSDRRSRRRCSEPTDGSGCAAGSGCSSSKRLPAVLLGLACLSVLSDRPADARWLDADERRWLLAKLQARSRPTAAGGTVEPPAGAVEQARAGAERRPGGKHRGEQRASALAASDHQVVRPDEHADRTCSTPFRSRSRPSS